jgi:hypothetical protein
MRFKESCKELENIRFELYLFIVSYTVKPKHKFLTIHIIVEHASEGLVQSLLKFLRL